MNGTADPAPPPSDLARLMLAVLAAEPVTVSADAQHGDVEHEARLLDADDWRAVCALLRSLDGPSAPSIVANGSDLCPTCRGIGCHLDGCAAAHRPLAKISMCSCGKPATHLDAPEDSDDWACLVRDPNEVTPPSWLHDERGSIQSLVP